MELRLRITYLYGILLRGLTPEICAYRMSDTIGEASTYAIAMLVDVVTHSSWIVRDIV